MINVKINTPFIKLDQLLKYAGIVNSGSDAKKIILDEKVLVNGQIVTQRGKKIVSGDIVEIKNGEKIKVSGD